MNRLRTRPVRERFVDRGALTGDTERTSGAPPVGALAEFERLIRERTAAGLAAAAARDRKGGRHPVGQPENLTRAEAAMAAGLTVQKAAGRVKVGKTALYGALVKHKATAL